MSPVQRKFLSVLLRSAVFGFSAAGLFCACAAANVQERAGGERRSPFMNRIDVEEGARRLATFRRQRLEGDFCFQFALEHKPRRARTVRFDGMMWGSWNDQGPVTRFRVSPCLNPASDEVVEPVDLIIQNGPVQQVWMRHGLNAPFELLEGEALFEPILPGLLYSPFDLQMPFVYWKEFAYEGPTLVGSSRVAQQFLMRPPQNSASAERGIAGVRMGLDDTYNALWRVEVLGMNQENLSRFSVESIKKVQGQYIVKRITLKDYKSKERTTFEVKAAAVGLSLSRDLFCVKTKILLDDYLPNTMQRL